MQLSYLPYIPQPPNQKKLAVKFPAKTLCPQFPGPGIYSITRTDLHAREHEVLIDCYVCCLTYISDLDDCHDVDECARIRDERIQANIESSKLTTINPRTIKKLKNSKISYNAK